MAGLARKRTRERGRFPGHEVGDGALPCLIDRRAANGTCLAGPAVLAQACGAGDSHSGQL
jgi:hypothetical protein